MPITSVSERTGVRPALAFNSAATICAPKLSGSVSPQGLEPLLSIRTCMRESEVLGVPGLPSRSAMNWVPEKSGWNRVQPFQFWTLLQLFPALQLPGSYGVGQDPECVFQYPGVLPLHSVGVPCWLRLPETAPEGDMHWSVANTGRLASVKMAETPSAAPASLRREGLISLCGNASGKVS